MFLYEVIVLVSLSFSKILSLIFSLVWLFTYAKAITMFTFNDPLAMKTVKRTCVSSLVGVAFWFLRFCPFSVFFKFPFFCHRRQKFNRLELAQKFMQVGVDVTCMYTNFGGRGLSSFGDKIGLKSMVIKKFN